MKKNILITLLLFPFFYMTGQQAIMPAHTHAAIQLIRKELDSNRNLPSQHVLDFYPIYKMKGRYMISAMAKVNASFNKTQAIHDGIEVGAVVGSIITMRMPVEMLREGFSYPGIEYLEVADKTEPELDKALGDIRADLVHKGIGLPQPYTGKNVVIGIADWGFDYTHPMFYDTTLTHSRILAAWDQEKVIGTPPPGFTHGVLYANPAELAAAQHDTLSIIHDYHATHVAGIAGGSGAGTVYRGIGFESDFLFSQMTKDVGGSLDAFQWMFEEAQSMGKRLVINNSWGGYRTYPLDGTSLLSQAIDELSYEGVVFVFSGGNNGNINFHLKKDFQNDSLRTQIQGFDYVNDHELWGQTVSMWGEPGHSFSAQLRILNGPNDVIGKSVLVNTATAPALIDTFLVFGVDTVFYNFITDASHPLNGRPQMTLNVKSTNPAWKKTLLATAESGTVHFWNTRLTTYGGGNWGFGFTAPATGYVNGDKNYGIGHPGVTTSVITTAAHQTNYLLTSFSSYGPRIDGLMKPDISAPGLDIVSSFNSFAVETVTPVATITFNNKSYGFIKLSGTSMSAPMVTGSVALLLEANPNLSPAQVKDILLGSARTDNLTGTIPPEGNIRWGHGKLDIYNAIQSIVIEATHDHLIKSNDVLYPNPAKDVVYIKKELTGNETYHLTRIDGAEISNGHFDGKVNLDDVANGMYILTIGDLLSRESFMVVVKK
ncbi:MAG: S8 family serine peptidase [Saprospiraceae bacterium]